MFAQTKKTVFTLPAYSQTPFDPTSLRVPPHFMGHDVARLYHEFAALDNAVKAEFETKDQFNKRLDLAEAKLFMGSKTETTTLSFVVPVSSEYDADTETLGVRVHGGPDRDNAVSILVRQAITGGRSYVATNPFGVKIAVHQTSINSYFLLINNPDQFQNADLSVAIKMPPNEARKIKSTLSALAICTIIKDEKLTDQDTSRKTPTLDDPQEVFAQQWFFKAHLMALWFFDSSSGVVHAKVEATEKK
jgi:hypothetical protein